MIGKVLFLFLFTISSGLSKAGGDSLLVYIFLAEGCPICQSVTPALNSIQKEYEGKGLKMIGLFPSAISSDSSRKAFAEKFNVVFPLMNDRAGHYVQKFGASITPEVILLDASGQNVVYRGLVDDSFAAVGKRRKVSKNQYLKNAIQTYLTTFESSEFTHPVGCKITLAP
jgi:thiol-disulfide isomerase/thioredoxin